MPVALAVPKLDVADWASNEKWLPKIYVAGWASGCQNKKVAAQGGSGSGFTIRIQLLGLTQLSMLAATIY